MSYRALPPFGGDARAVAEVVNGLMQGKSNNTGSIELSTGTTTTLTDPRIGAQSVIVFMPTTLSAAGTSLHVTGRQSGQCTLNHAAGAAGRNFSYVIVG